MAGVGGRSSGQCWLAVLLLLLLLLLVLLP
jgi:hypothetical protein